MKIIENIKDRLDGYLHDVPKHSREHVEKTLDAAAAAIPGALKWRTSIVDLLKLCGLDSDYATRQKVAYEFGMTNYAGTAEENAKLHELIFNDIRGGGIDLPEIAAC